MAGAAAAAAAAGGLAAAPAAWPAAVAPARPRVGRRAVVDAAAHQQRHADRLDHVEPPARGHPPPTLTPAPPRRSAQCIMATLAKATPRTVRSAGAASQRLHTHAAAWHMQRGATL